MDKWINMDTKGNTTANKKGRIIGLARRDWRYRLFVNARLRVASIRGFRRRWFLGRRDDRAHPNAKHIRSINERLRELRRDDLEKRARRLGALVKDDVASSLENFKQVRHDLDRRIARVQNLWDFFFDIFSQRRGVYASFLRRCDDVVGECYKLVFNKLEKPNPWTGTPPLCYLEKAFSPATIRRGVRFLSRVNVSTTNPFPVIKIPYDRVAIPWTLTSLVHEVSHNIHGDIPNFWQGTKLNVYRTLRRAGIPKQDARVWSFWHKETLADLLGILLGGPAVVRSLMDMMSRPRDKVMGFRPNDSHPTPYLRVLISTYTLGRLGFAKDAARMQREWKKRYPLTKGHRIPKNLLKTAPRAIPIVVRTLLWTPYRQLGGKRLVELVNYSKKMHRRVLAGSTKLVVGDRSAGLPKRLIISAAVYAFERCPDKAKAIRRAVFRALDSARRVAAPAAGKHTSTVVRKNKTAAGRVRALPSGARVVRLPLSRSG